MLLLWPRWSSIFSSPRCRPAGLQALYLINVPVLSPGVRVQEGMEEEKDAEEKDSVYTVSVQSGCFPWKPASWPLSISSCQAKKSVFIIGPAISKSRSQMVELSFEWSDNFRERPQIILKHFLEFKNGSGCLYRHSQCVLFFSLSEGLYEDIC